MKKITKIFLFSVMSLFIFSACSIKEEIVLNAAGDGTYNYLFSVENNDLFDESNNKNKKKSKDSIISETKLNSANFKEFIDYNLSKKAVFENKEFLMDFEEDLKNCEVNRVESKLKTEVSFRTNFASLEQVKDGNLLLLKYLNFESISGIAKSKHSDLFKDKKDIDKALNLKFVLNGNHFSRKVTFENTNINKSISPTEERMIESMGAFFKYVTIITFPKTIENFSNSAAVISKDKKTITIETSFIELMSDPKKWEFEIELSK